MIKVGKILGIMEIFGGFFLIFLLLWIFLWGGGSSSEHSEHSECGGDGGDWGLVGAGVSQLL